MFIVRPQISCISETSYRASPFDKFDIASFVSHNVFILSLENETTPVSSFYQKNNFNSPKKCRSASQNFTAKIQTILNHVIVEKILISRSMQVNQNDFYKTLLGYLESFIIY